MYGNMSEDLGAHRQQQRHSPTRWDEDQFAGERDLEVGEAARVEVFEDAVAPVTILSLSMDFAKLVEIDEIKKRVG